MNALGLALIGCLARGTVFAALGLALGAVLRRRGPAAGAWTSLTTLAGLTAVSALALSPWPHWWTLSPASETVSVGLAMSNVARDHPTAPPVSGEVSSSRDQSRPDPPHALPSESWGTLFFQELTHDLRQPPTPQAPRRGWPAWVAWAFVAGMGFGLIRLLLGLRGVRTLTHRARPVEDSALIELVEQLRSELACLRAVVVRETSAITTAATVGWRRPVVLLPLSWRSWTDAERRVVLAHELAHVSRRDYLSGLIGRLSVALHFYHPLAHWLWSRLRLEQELAADACAAPLAGGPHLYLTTLAQMALRQPERPLTWPARAFLPTHGTFIRRIEMLRDSKHFKPIALTRRTRAGTLITLAIAGLIVAGLRGPQATQTAQAQTPQQPAAPSFDLSYVPAEAEILLAVRPAELAQRPETAPLVDALRQYDRGMVMGIPVEQIDQILVFLGSSQRPQGGSRFLERAAMTLIRSTQPLDVPALARELNNPPKSDFQGHVIYQADWGPMVLLDERTIASSDLEDVKTLIQRGKSGPRVAHSWDEAWKKIPNGQGAIAVGGPWLAAHYQPLLDRPGETQLKAFSPLWTQASGYALGIDLTKGVKLNGAAVCDSEQGAAQVAETLKAVLVLGGNALRLIQQQDQATKRAMSDARSLADLGIRALAPGRTERDGTVVRFVSEPDISVQNFAQVLQMGAHATGFARQRIRSVNNLKRLGLAMHNYHEKYNHFPPAVSLGPDGKTPHSLRVEILPLLNEETLYKQYNLNEPWDSPNNRKVLEQIPSVFRVGRAGGAPTNTCYFALTGPDTMFADAKGTSIRQVVDGTSNTILFVEARRDVPWTKPEDIPFDPKEPLPTLGGYFERGFNAAFADGAVRFISENVNKDVLKSLITKAGHKVVSVDQF